MKSAQLRMNIQYFPLLISLYAKIRLIKRIYGKFPAGCILVRFCLKPPVTQECSMVGVLFTSEMFSIKKAFQNNAKM